MKFLVSLPPTYPCGLLLASSPGPTQKIGKGTLAKIPVCAKSAHYATHPNNDILYVIDPLRSSHASALRNVNVIPLLQTKTADTTHTGIFASNTRPLSQFLGGPGDEARLLQDREPEYEDLLQ